MKDIAAEFREWQESLPEFGKSEGVDREFRRQVFLALLPAIWNASRTHDEVENAIPYAWSIADEAIKQEGA